MSSWRSTSPPCVGGSYYPNRACTSHGTCPMDHRTRNAPATSRRTRAQQSTSARRVARRRITRTRRETTQPATHPTPRPRQKNTPTSIFRTTSPEKTTPSPLTKKKKHSDNSPEKNKQKTKSSKTKVAKKKSLSGFPSSDKQQPKKKAFRKKSSNQKVALRKKVATLAESSFLNFGNRAKDAPATFRRTRGRLVGGLVERAQSCIVIADACGEGAFLSRHGQQRAQSITSQTQAL